MAQDITSKALVTYGIDIGDKKSFYFSVDPRTGESKKGTLRTTKKELQRKFEGLPESRVILESCTHSRWMSSLLKDLGHEVVVADPRRLRWISQDPNKSDLRDAEKLALLGQSSANLRLIKPIEHRSEQCQADLTIVKARGALVKCRTQLINVVRQTTKGFGHRLPSSSSEAFPRKVEDELPDLLQGALRPLLAEIQTLTETIRCYDKRIEELCQKRYPETEGLRQIVGVGALTALTFVLTLEDPKRFRTSRSAGAFLGLVPKRDQSGDVDKQLRITKAGNADLRALLISCAHYVLGWRGPNCQLRRYGERISSRGGKIAKKKAVVAVARKLAVLMHHLWLTGEEYDPEHVPASLRKRRAG